MRFLYPWFIEGRGAVGLLIVRVVVGLAFVLHGWPKIQNPFGWMPGEAFPAPLLAAAAVAEFGGGLALIAGLLTPLAALLIGGVMVVAIGKVHVPAGHPFVSATPPSYELATVYLAIAVLFLLIGPGKFSLDAILFARRQQV